MNRAFTKAERLNKLQLMLSSTEKGLTRSELSHKTGFSKATISRDIAELSLECPLIEDEITRRLSIDRVSILTNLYLNAEEIQALHLACRLLGRKVRFHYPSASSALRKLGSALNHYAEPLALGIIATAELFEAHSHENQTHYAETVRIITEGIMKGLSVRFERFSRRENCWKDCLFSSYCIEPYAEGNSLYLVGIEKSSSEVRTIKFELIKNIRLTALTYKAPADFRADSYFRNSWGIWTSAENPRNVELVFSKNVKNRVLQTEWHSSEKTEIIADGRLRWTAEISEPKEMLPWIRGWGSDVEVIKPIWLRKMVIDDVSLSSRQYGLQVLSACERER